uniref:uncharacterized protein LOC122583726 n=1 Tax=Erigeron canadensis TaxID=72917 RepID=UPI001CB9D543|nr:uncharacterized protein LOC122583726 [Erigeron canadensis]
MEFMPWVGLYICAASLVCTLAMAADVFNGFRLGKLWFPCRFFTVNAVSITVIAIAMKLLVDLSANTEDDDNAKDASIFFLVTMVASFLPSLGLMGDKELLINIIAFGILLITILVNISVVGGLIGVYVLPCLLAFSVALTVPASRRNLELQYKGLRRLASNHDEINFSYEELAHYVKMHWMMAETGDPQFAIACSQISFSFVAICSYFAISAVISLRYPYFPDRDASDYQWSIKIIFYVQYVGVLLGCVAPISRCFTVTSYLKPSKKWSKNHLNVFKVEKQWIERLEQWKRIHVRSHIPGRHCKKVFHLVKNMILNICIALQIVAAVICKMICLLPRCFLILFFYCWYLCKLLLKRFKWGSKNDYISEEEVEKYAKYVMLAEEEANLSERILTNMLRSITKLIKVSTEKEPKNLMKLILDKSTGFNGVIKFDNDEVPPLYPEETQNCWSLVAVTLMTIAIALPNISNRHVKELLASMREGLQIVRNIEETLNDNAELVGARKAARHLWTEVELYNKWLHIDLQKKFSKSKSTNQILQCSMYRISQTILLHCNTQENWPNDGELFEWISTIIADIFCACFTNLPSVIKMKCHHDAIEKRRDSIQIAARLLGKSKKILEILEDRQLPNLDIDSMAYINKWRALPNSQTPNRCTSSTRVQLTSSRSSDLLMQKFPIRNSTFLKTNSSAPSHIDSPPSFQLPALGKNFSMMINARTQANYIIEILMTKLMLMSRNLELDKYLAGISNTKDNRIDSQK